MGQRLQERQTAISDQYMEDHELEDCGKEAAGGVDEEEYYLMFCSICLLEYILVLGVLGCRFGFRPINLFCI